MATVLGTDKINYQPVEGWAKLPEGWRFKECAGVAVDSRDRVYVFSRGEHPVMVFDREGNFLTSWGEGLFDIPHGITVAPDDSIYCVDNGDHTVRKLTNEGELLMTLGREDHPPPRWSGASFNQPTHLAVSPKTGDLYISDGYGNSRIHKYNPEGQHILSWGTPGIDPGQFVIPHNIAVDEEDNVYVADRERTIACRSSIPKGIFSTSGAILGSPPASVSALTATFTSPSWEERSTTTMLPTLDTGLAFTP